MVFINNFTFLYFGESVSNRHRNQADDVLLEAPHFVSSVYMSTKHLGLGFTYGAPNIWNNLPDDVCSATCLYSLSKKLKIYLFAKAYSP